MKFLKKFETNAAYTDAESSLILPNVSFVTEGNTVHYKPYDPAMGHDYVEIGGLKWATMNIGAESVTDAGLYFSWADVQGYSASQISGSSLPHHDFDTSEYKYGTYNAFEYPDHGMTKYCHSDSKTILDDEDDAAKTIWGGNWEVPSKEDFISLGESVITAWTNNYQNSGVRGVICTDKNDSSKILFLPATNGIGQAGEMMGVEYYSAYWSNSIYDGDCSVANILELYYDSGGKINFNSSEYRHSGYSIRPVIKHS